MTGPTTGTQPHVVAVVLNWNDYENTQACLSSLDDVEYDNVDVVVVDNGSSDGSGERLDEEFGWCEFLYVDENRGFAGGNNVGIEHAMDAGADYVLLLNNDTVVEPDFLTPLVDVAEADDDVALLSGIMRDEAGDVWYSGGEFLAGECRVARYDEVPTWEDPYETEFVAGAMILARAEFVEECEVFPDGYFFAMEDVDVSWQALDDGWRLLVVPSSEIVHKVGESTGDGRSPFRVYHETHGRLHMASTRLAAATRLRFYLYFLVARVVFSVRWYRSGRTDWISATWAGVRDFLTNSYPRESMTG